MHTNLCSQPHDRACQRIGGEAQEGVGREHCHLHGTLKPGLVLQGGCVHMRV